MTLARSPVHLRVLPRKKEEGKEGKISINLRNTSSQL